MTYTLQPRWWLCREWLKEGLGLGPTLHVAAAAGDTMASNNRLVKNLFIGYFLIETNGLRNSSKGKQLKFFVRLERVNHQLINL